MSAKRNKKMSMKEIKAPDEFQAFMAKTIEFLREYGAWILAGMAVIIVAIVSGILISRYNDAVMIDDAIAFDRAFAPVAEAAVITGYQLEADEEDEESATEESKGKLASAAEDLGQFSTEYDDSPLAGLALLARGAATLGAGDAQSSFEVYKEYLSANPDSSFAFVAWEALGYAADKAGDRTEAIRAFSEMAKSGSSLARANAYLHLGDLFNPASSIKNDEESDAGKANEYYEKGLKEVGGEPTLMGPVELVTRRTLEQRISALK